MPNVAEYRKKLNQKVDNASLILNDADTFLWARQEHPLSKIPGGGNWLILIGVLCVMNLLGKMSYLDDTNLSKISVRKMRKNRKNISSYLRNFGISEQEGFIRLYNMRPSGVPWNAKKSQLKRLWVTNRHALAHLAFPKVGSGVIPNKYGSYLKADCARALGKTGDVCIQVPNSKSLIFNSDNLSHVAREIIPIIKERINKACYRHLQIINVWCGD